MIAIDSTFFPYLLKHKTRVPVDPSTGNLVEHLEERIDLLLETLQEDGETIIIPAPALSEFLVLAKDDGPKYLEALNKNPLFDIKPFDQMAAIELAAMRIKSEKALSKNAIKRQSPAETRAKISFDRQIVAIAIVNRAHTIYSEDEGVAKFATANQLRVVRVWDLPRPRETQGILSFHDIDDPDLKPSRKDISSIQDRLASPDKLDRDTQAEPQVDID